MQVARTRGRRQPTNIVTFGDLSKNTRHGDPSLTLRMTGNLYKGRFFRIVAGIRRKLNAGGNRTGTGGYSQTVTTLVFRVARMLVTLLSLKARNTCLDQCHQEFSREARSMSSVMA